LLLLQRRLHVLRHELLPMLRQWRRHAGRLLMLLILLLFCALLVCLCLLLILQLQKLKAIKSVVWGRLRAPAGFCRRAFPVTLQEQKYWDLWLHDIERAP
jgi:hypothetical protein